MQLASRKRGRVAGRGLGEPRLGAKRGRVLWEALTAGQRAPAWAWAEACEVAGEGRAWPP
jgi:hypothetical protein